MQASLTRNQVVRGRGVDCLLFQVVRRSSRKYSDLPLRPLSAPKMRCDLVLAAVIPSSPFSILCSQTVRVRFSPVHQYSGFLRLEWLARIAEHSTITCWGRLCPWRNSFMADSPKFLTSEEMETFAQKVSIRTPGVQELVMVSKDRATLVFSQWQGKIKSRSAWQTPFALALSLIATLVTSTFQDSSWIKGGTLKGIFWTFAALACAWFFYEMYRLISTRNMTAEQFIEDLAAGSTVAELPTSTVKRVESN
jgi:hypothetical protein